MTIHEHRLVAALQDMLRVYEMLMPGLRYIAVQDYQIINEAPIRAQEAIDAVNAANALGVELRPGKYVALDTLDDIVKGLRELGHIDGASFVQQVLDGLKAKKTVRFT